MTLTLDDPAQALLLLDALAAYRELVFRGVARCDNLSYVPPVADVSGLARLVGNQLNDDQLP